MSARRKLHAVAPQDEPPVGDELTLPHSLEAERSVLGSILTHNDAFEAAGRTVTPADFYRDAHRRIFEAMTHLIDERRSVVDYVTLKEELARTGHLDEVGGSAYIASLTDGVPRATNVEYYARIVKEKAALRACIFAANAVLSAAYSATDPPETILRNADLAFLQIASGHTASRLVDLRTRTQALIQDIEFRVEHRGQLTGITTGFESINQLTIGWQTGDLIIIAARPSIGKTTLMMNSLVAAARAGKKVAVFSLEMRTKQIQYRLLSSLSGVSLEQIANGFLAGGDYAKVSAGLNILNELPIHIDDRSGQTFQDIRGTCRRLKAEQGLDVVGIDYVQLMPGTLDRKGANRNEEVTDISRRLKTMADELGLPVLLLSQLSRAGSKRQDPRPQLSDLRESGSLEQDADIVAFLHRKNHKEGGYTEFIVEKARNGPTGTLGLTFERDISTFVDGGTPPLAPARKGKPETSRLPVDGD